MLRQINVDPVDTDPGIFRVISDTRDSEPTLESSEINSEMLSGPDVPESATETRRSSRSTFSIPPERYGFDAFSAEEFCVDDPKSWEDAMNSQLKNKWKDATDKEYNSLMRHNAWTLCELPAGRNVVSNRWVFRTKTDESGEACRFKARLVAKGFSQKYGTDYLETFAPVVRHDSIRCLISIAVNRGMLLHQFDVETAFLNGKLDETIFMKQPEGYIVEGKENLVCKLSCSLYGLKQSPRCWNFVLKDQLLDMGLNCSENDPCVYEGIIDSERVMLAVYVDDMILAATSENVIKHAHKLFLDRFDVKYIGPLRYFLGVRIVHHPNSILLVQDRYAENVVKKFRMDDSFPVSTPMEAGSVLVKRTEGDKEFDPFIYQSAIGCLLYLSNFTRPDLCFAVHKLAQFSKDPSEVHWKAVKRVLSYLKGTLKLGIKFEKECIGNIIVVFCDADFAGDLQDRKSTSGHVLFNGKCPISWLCQKQSITALSTAEAEYVSLCEAAKKIVWTRRLFTDLNCPQTEPTIVYEDNKAAIAISLASPGENPKVKHIALRYHYTRDCIENRVIKLEYCSSQEMTADIFTKPLPKDTFLRLRNSLGLCTINEI